MSHKICADRTSGIVTETIFFSSDHLTTSLTSSIISSVTSGKVNFTLISKNDDTNNQYNFRTQWRIHNEKMTIFC